MPIALPIAGLPSQPHQGVGARLVRRLGGAVRSAIVSAITLTGARRRPAVSQTSRDRAAAQHPDAPAPSRVRVPHAPQAALPAPLLPPPWLALLLARRRRRPARPNRADPPFTPEAYPQLSPKACAVLNTPLKDCDPKTLELVVSTFTQYINQVMAPEAGISDHAATLPNLWHRLSIALDDAKADTTVPATPEPAPATPAGAVPDVPVLSPDPPAPAPPTGPAMPPVKASAPLSGPPASDQPPDPPITTAAPQTTPHIAATPAPLVHPSWPSSNLGRSFRHHTQSFAPWCRPSFRYCRALFPRALRDALQCQPPPWRLYYAACTGPP
jgi:hypothetical protein